MKKIIFTAFLLSATLAAEETPSTVQNSYGYFGIGLGPAPIPLPVFAGGYRMQWNHHGLDLSLDTITFGNPTLLKGNVIYNYYPSPDLQSQAYYGVGLTVGGVLGKYSHGSFGLSPEFLLGKEYVNDAKSRRFFEARISWPSFTGMLTDCLGCSEPACS